MGFSYFFSAEFIRYPRYIDKREALMEPLGTIWNYLERPPGYWNSRRLLEQPQASGTPAGFWNARRALSGYSCITRVRVCDGNAMRVR